MYSVIEALASTISGARSFSDGVAGGHFGDGGGREAGEGMEEDNDAGDAGNCGYKDAGSSIANFWRSSSKEMLVFDGVAVLAAPIVSDASSNDSTV